MGQQLLSLLAQAYLPPRRLPHRPIPLPTQHQTQLQPQDPAAGFRMPDDDDDDDWVRATLLLILPESP